MAVIARQELNHPYSNNPVLYKWPSMAGGDTGARVVVPHKAEATFMIIINTGTPTVVVKGTLDPDEEAVANFIGLKDGLGAAISMTADDVSEVLQNCYAYAPEVAAGGGIDVDVYLMLLY